MNRMEQLQKLRVADPSDPDVPYMIAQEHAKQGEHDLALAAYDACLTLDPDYHYAYFHKARVLESEDRREDAVTTLKLGLARAKAARHEKAAGEIAGYLDELT